MLAKKQTIIAEERISGSLGKFHTRLAVTQEEIKKSQQLRYQVFFREMSAKPDIRARISGRDQDRFDPHCDHLLVVSQNDNPHKHEKIVGSYRLLKQQNTAYTHGFYSASEFDVDALVNRHPTKNFLELGRSCILPQYRNKRTIELLWHGTWSYILKNKIDVLFGCASFPTTNPEEITEALSMLYHHHLATDEWAMDALDGKKLEMNRIPKAKINPRSALRKLPPLVKGYLRLGAQIGDGAVIDHQFGTIDVMIIIPVKHLNPRYVSYYGEEAQRFDR